MLGLNKMIFKRLFRPKFQDPNPQVRIDAIKALDPQNAEHKSHLHELAFNDEDPGVSLAALSRLDSFALWCKMSEIAKLERVKKKATAMVESALFSSNETQISLQDKRTFIVECKNNALLEKCLKQDWVIEKDTDLALNILTKLDKANLKKQYLLQSQNEALQIQLLLEVEEESTLNKVIKRVNSDKVKQLASEKLEELKLLKTKPAEIEQKASLVLSRLLALREKNDFPVIKQSKESLEQEFEMLKSEFSYLSEAKKSEFEEKYSQLKEKLEDTLTSLAPQWEAAQKELTAKIELEKIESEASTLFKTISDCLAKDARHITLGQVEEFEQQLQKSKDALCSFVESFQPVLEGLQIRIENVFNQLNGTNATLKRLPEFQQAIEHAEVFLDKFAALALPSDLSQIEASQAYLKEQKQLWKGFKDNFQSNWPDNLDSRWKALQANWRETTKCLQSRVEKDFARCRSKLKAIDSLIEQGRYKAAFSLYQRTSEWYQALPEKYQVKLSRQYEKVKQGIENLKDWQDYVAQPRKPALLKAVEELVETPQDVNEQAKAVKQIRAQWNSLGKLHTEADDALNDAFEIAIEKAFEPCRIHYEAVNTQRAVNAQAKQAVIVELTALTENQMDDFSFVSKLSELQQRWRDIGEVGFKQLDDLKKAYNNALEPHKKRRQALFDNYAEQKQQLIKKASLLLENDNVFEAVEQVKQLQLDWRKVPLAGRKKDNALWTEFRAINDKIFARRSETQAENKQKNEEITGQIDALLGQAKSLISSAKKSVALNDVGSITQQIEDVLNDLPKKLQDKYKNTLQRLSTSRAEKEKQLAKTRQKKVYQDVFLVLHEWSEEARPEAVKDLPNQWQQAFDVKGAPDKRPSITLQMEIVANAISPEADSAQRQQLQLQMLADKLEKGDEQDLDGLLKTWIQCGPLSKSDVSLLNRVEKLFQ